MLPTLWIIDTYSLMIFIGVLLCFYLYLSYAKKNKINRKFSYDILLLACISIMLGLGSAMLFQFIFDSLKENSTNPLFSMTFFGGLIGGVITFIIGYHLYIKKHYPQSNFLSDVVIVAPACITTAHGFGRIGCFLAGCCYGKQTDSFWGVKFPHLAYNVYPTQLFESIFLLILSSILFLLAYKFKNKYTFPIYLTLYGIFRFLIEFIRGDDRGALFLSLTPSQGISILCVLIAIILTIYFKLTTNTKNTNVVD